MTIEELTNEKLLAEFIRSIAGPDVELFEDIKLDGGMKNKGMFLMTIKQQMGIIKMAESGKIFLTDEGKKMIEKMQQRKRRVVAATK